MTPLSKENQYNLQPLFIFACLLCSLPIILTTYPPMVDISQHAGQISFLNDWLHDEFKFKELFELNWFTPYWLGYGITLFIAQFTTVVIAIKIVISLTLILFPISCALFRKAAHIPAYFDWLFLPLGFGFAFDWGFLNFLIGAPIGMLFLRDVLRYQQNEVSPWRMAIWVNILFFTHMLIMLFFCAIGFFLLLPKQFSIVKILKKTAPLFASVPVTLVWFLIHIQAGQSQEPGPWDLGFYRFQQFFPNMLSLPATIHFIGISIIICLLPVLIGKPLSKSPGKLFPFFFYSIWMLLGPNYLFGNYFTYNRFAMFGLPLYFLMFDYTQSFYSAKHIEVLKAKMKLIKLFTGLIGVLLIVRLASNSLIYERESLGYQYISQYMQPGKKALTLVFNNQSFIHNNKLHASIAPLFLHYPAWYQSTHKGLVDYNFASFDGMTVHYKDQYQPRAGRGFEWLPNRFHWHYHNAHQYDYFVVKSNENLLDTFQKSNKQVKLIAQRADWWLFEQKEAK